VVTTPGSDERSVHGIPGQPYRSTHKAKNRNYNSALWHSNFVKTIPSTIEALGKVPVGFRSYVFESRVHFHFARAGVKVEGLA
jgi:hypothetical protein